jgi:AcrR family transcriptional regulator
MVIIITGQLGCGTRKEMPLEQTVKRGRTKVSRAALLEAAAAIFFEQGYAATGIDAIIERAGGSKRNIYNEFGSKDGLFAAIITENVEKVLAPFAVDNLVTHNLRSTLLAFGTALIEGLLSPPLLGIYRIAVTESARFPGLAGRFYDHGPGHASARLTQVLEAARRRGELRVSDCAIAADQFVGLIRGNLHLQVVLGLRAVPDADETGRWVGTAVDLFLEGARA